MERFNLLIRVGGRFYHKSRYSYHICQYIPHSEELINGQCLVLFKSAINPQDQLLAQPLYITWLYYLDFIIPDNNIRLIIINRSTQTLSYSGGDFCRRSIYTNVIYKSEFQHSYYRKHKIHIHKPEKSSVIRDLR